MMNRRDSIKSIGVTIGALFVGGTDLFGAPTTMTVYKSPTCGCCGSWIKHIKAAGFTVKEVDLDDLVATKKKFGVPDDLVSCHTGVVGAYAFEGHVPADLIARFLKAPPKGAKGLAVPGMPLGSPGMEVGGRKDAYDVVLFQKSGARSVYAKR
jgi:hypothetical protein